MCVYVKRVERKGPNGDRAQTLTSYYDYEIYVNSIHVDTISGYDTWRTAIKDREAVEREALKYARKLKDATNGRVWRNF